MGFPVHPTADQVYTALKQYNPNLSIGTVYRNINKLSEMGMLIKIKIADGSDRFDGRTDLHYHMVCDKCSQVYDVELSELDKIRSVVSEKYGHTLTGVTLNLNGVCCECSKLT
ncbi:MAG: transcriptional repressor [Oscillospiraceae bacterium]|nr:transcriptional repressor [Oscillospiraceae bacterium]